MFKLNSVRRCICCILAAVMLTASFGCSRGNGTPTCASTAEAVLMSQSSLPPMTFVGYTAVSDDGGETTSEVPDDFSTWLRNVYDIDPATVTDGAVYYADGASADEIAVLRFDGAAGAGSAARSFKKYVKNRADAFAGYGPEAEKMLSDALILQQGDYAALIVVPSPSTAEIAFDGSFHVPEATSEESSEGSELPAEQTETQTAEVTQAQLPEDENTETEAQTPTYSYNHDAIVSAWHNQDPTSLSAQDRNVYDAAARIIAETTNDSMSPYQKELAVHNRLVDIIDYDALALARDSELAAPPESSTPYGALVLGQAICYGYSSSFQLLMDMLGIECITVDGTINEENDPHSWNMVNLDGNWYIVDVTWDDPIGGSLSHTFFNRTDQECTAYNRRWDRRAYPHAEGGVWEGPDANGL